jgi:hypothetical protein
MQNSGIRHPLYSATKATNFVFANTSGDILVFYNLVYVSESLAFTNNAATAVDFPVLTAVAGNFVVSGNGFLVSLHIAALERIEGRVWIIDNTAKLTVVMSPLRAFEANCEGLRGAVYLDLPGCLRIISHRLIEASSAKSLSSSILSYAEGYLDIKNNSALATIDLPVLTTVTGNLDVDSNDVLAGILLPLLSVVGFYLAIESNMILTAVSLPSLSYIGTSLYVTFNPSLTMVHLPKLTSIHERIFICRNNVAFRIPSNPPSAPEGGLAVTGSNKGMITCWLQEGSDSCELIQCP